MPDNSSSFFLQRKPRVVATISQRSGWDLAKKLDLDALDCPDLLEVRADLLLENHAELPGQLSDLPLPTILTVRHPAEGGKGSVDAESRADVYRKYWQNAAAIDLELAFARELSVLIKDAHERQISCILSYHHFVDTPSPKQLLEMTATAAAFGADLFKVATTTNQSTQLSSLLKWTEATQAIPTAAMGMGRLGRISRPLLGQLGSQLNYGYLDEPLVAGQWPAAELQRLIKSLP